MAFIRFSTQTKLRIARALYFLVMSVRKVTGHGSSGAVCRRGGLRWDLDLKEGIDLSIFVFSRFERRTSVAIASHLFPGAIALDIGANIGAHALPMAKQAAPGGCVYAIEPTSWAFGRLVANKNLNPELEDSLRPINAALTDGSTPIPQQIHSSWDLFGADVHPVHGGSLRSAKDATVTTLDALVKSLGLSRIDFVKMDVDGFECKVLRGARDTFTRLRPTMILELAPGVLAEHGDSLETLLSLLKDFGYSLKTEDGKRPLPMSASELANMIPSGGGINALATG
jgi:FkbM family methyltransferase